MLKIPDYPDFGSRDDSRVRAGLMTERFPFAWHAEQVGIARAYSALVAWLDVEDSPRWQPRRKGKGNTLATYCNIYACDMARQMTPGNIHAIPRVWWTSQGVREMERHAGVYPPVEWGETVLEMGANSLADWFAEHGAEHGFTVIPATIENEPEIEQAVSKGAIGFVSCAIRRTRKAEAQPLRRNGSGHITVVLPPLASTVDGAGLLQSQAGATNRALFRSRWWEAGKFSPAGNMGGRRLFVYKYFEGE
jgi:hypothetical protein